jgi:hypothetical protein
MLTDSLKTLSNPPSFKEKMEALADVNARISVLETQLGIKHTLHGMNANRATARLKELESQLAAKGLTPPPAASAPVIAAAVAPVAPTLDAGRPTASLAEFYKMDTATREQFAADGGTLAKSDFDKLTLSAKSKFCIAGGRILDDTGAGSRPRCTAAASFGNK